MIKQVTFDETYNEGKLRTLLVALHRAGNQAPIEVSLKFEGAPDVSFLLNGTDHDNIIAQANMIDVVTKDLAAKRSK